MDLSSYLLYPRETLDKISGRILVSFIEEIIEEELRDEFTEMLPHDPPLIIQRTGHGLYMVVINMNSRTYKLLLQRARIANASSIHGGEEIRGLEAIESLEEEGEADVSVYRVHPPTAKAIRHLITGYDPFDRIHEEMISLANSIIMEKITGKLGEAREAVERLCRHTNDKRFPYEEGIMSKYNYTNTDERLKPHRLSGYIGKP